MRVEQEHVRAGCNRTVGAVAWGTCGVIAYGAHHCVCLFDAEVRRLEALTG